MFLRAACSWEARGDDSATSIVSVQRTGRGSGFTSPWIAESTEPTAPHLLNQYPRCTDAMQDFLQADRSTALQVPTVELEFIVDDDPEVIDLLIFHVDMRIAGAQPQWRQP